MAALRFPEKEGCKQRKEGENLGLVTSPRFPSCVPWVGLPPQQPTTQHFQTSEERKDESGVERREKTAINSFVSALECPANPTAVKPEQGGN